MIYNELHHITPKSVKKSDDMYLAGSIDGKASKNSGYQVPDTPDIIAAEKELPKLMNKDQLQKRIKALRKELENSVKELDFINAAAVRDELKEVERLFNEYDK